MRATILVMCAAILFTGCATPQVTMPVGVAAIAYGQARSDYGAMRVLATQACVRGKLDKPTCEELTAVNARMQVLRQTIERSLLDPQTPVDWAAVLQYTEAVMGVMLKLGVIP